RMGVSAVVQLAFLGFLLACPIIFPQTMETALKFDVIQLMQPVTEIPVPPTPPPPKIKPKLKVRPPEPKPVVPKPVVAELNPRQPHVFMILKPALPKLRTLDAKPVDLKPKLEQTKMLVLTSQPTRPKEEPAPKKVQTGGF